MLFNGVRKIGVMMKIWKFFLFPICVVLLPCVFVLPHWNLQDIDEGEGDGSVQVYYINLDKAEERRVKIVPLLEKLNIPFERITAVYGRDLSREEKDKLVNRTIFKILMKKDVVDGEIGCYLSHIRTWKTFLQSKHSYALIIEDDASFNPNELKEVVDALIANKDKWDYVNLDPSRTGKGRNIQNIYNKFNLVAPTQRVWLTTCQLINRKAAKCLLQHALPIRMPVDHYIYRTWEHGYKYRIVSPHVTKQNCNSTYIESERYKEKWYIIIPHQIHRMVSGVMCYLMAYFR